MSTGSVELPGPFDDDELSDFPAWQEEALFARDFEGRLIRMDKATAADLEESIKITMDGHEVEIKKAVPATDEQGNVRKDEHGRVIPRSTTIYDAARVLYRENLDKPNPIPTLCHREYMDPVGVCRVCVVQVSMFKKRTGKVEVGRKLVPACQHRVEKTMIVDTVASADEKAKTRIVSAVKTLTELLMTDHPSPCAKEKQNPGDCELEALARQFNSGRSRLAGRERALPRDESLVIAVDHNACILCDRCVRGCDVIKKNHVIGRMGKGYQARIAFDLGVSMGVSTCVACGECADDCPTGALTHKRVIETKLAVGRDVTVDDLRTHPLPEISEAFQGVSLPFLRANIHAVKRRDFRKGEVICREGEFGATAFFIEKGSVDIFLRTPVEHVENQPKSGFWGTIGRFTTRLESRPEDNAREFIPVDAPVSLPYGRPQATMSAGDIFGEMTCMNSYPRSATVTAREDCTVLEMLRNIPYIMQRSPSFRGALEAKYRARTIDGHLRSVPLFAPLRQDEERFRRIVDELRPRISLLRFEPKQVIFRQGDAATDGLYLIRTGFVRVSEARPGGERVLSYLGPGAYFGEIGLLSELSELRDLGLTGVRTATCAALDHVDLVRITSADFRAILDQAPEVRSAMIAEARKRLESNRRDAVDTSEKPLEAFLDQGLMNAQNLMVLDLVKCTRCDECTKACADTHQGVTRLIREGLRFDKFLVASSCRSCLDPYCMVGCPVGSIRRKLSSEIVIENWCIGCGLCAENCPYGNINMVTQFDSTVKADVRKATTCDLCTSLGPNHEPSCVYACPHDAAHRMKGSELLDLVRACSIG
jgi:CRP-like cAMP-binding protein/Fe-S-cluster-containing dehydrogenase component